MLIKFSAWIAVQTEDVMNYRERSSSSSVLAVLVMVVVVMWSVF